ncbi:LysR family transcriptional regulator [Allokutzneria oryzae]|uniref:LysR family transcriptional regulator n=1 Tax=Allokutzneria oryzae TaxID=1378989 RepID=A0ABV6A194_9PSEU
MFHLRYFVAVADELNFSQAARKLHMAASPLSQRIKDLEHELGRTLFHRSTHGVRMSEAGEALLPIARELVEKFDSVPWRLREAMNPARSTVFVGVAPSLHPVLRGRLRELEHDCGEAYDVKLWPGTSADLMAGVREGRLAMALVRMPVTVAALTAVEVFSERLGAAVPADRFAGWESVALRDLVDLPYVPSPPDSTPAYFQRLDSHLDEAGVRKRLQLNQVDYAGIAEIISSGLAFSVTIIEPDSPMHLYQRENLALLPFSDFDPRLSTALVWHADRAKEGTYLHDLIETAKRIFAAQHSV